MIDFSCESSHVSRKTVFDMFQRWLDREKRGRLGEWYHFNGVLFAHTINRRYRESSVSLGCLVIYYADRTAATLLSPMKLETVLWSEIRKGHMHFIFVQEIYYRSIMKLSWWHCYVNSHRCSPFWERKYQEETNLEYHNVILKSISRN